VEALDPLDPSCDLSSLAFAFLELETVHPPYTPLPSGIAASADPAEDYFVALEALTAAMRSARSAVDAVRFALTIRLLRELEDSPAIGAASGQGPDDRDAQPRP
jgi:hypothetical protein